MATAAGTSAPPTLTETAARPRLTGMSTKLPAMIKPRMISAWTSVRRRRSSTRWAAPKKTRAATASSTVSPKGKDVPSFRRLACPCPASVPLPVGGYAGGVMSRCGARDKARRCGRRASVKAAGNRWGLGAIVIPVVFGAAGPLQELAQPLHHVADGDAFRPGIRVGDGLLLGLRLLGQGRPDAEANAAGARVQVDDLDLNLLAGLDDLRGVFHPPVGQLGDMDQALDAVLQLNEGPKVHHPGHFALPDHEIGRA